MTCQLWWYCQNRNHLCITTIWQTFWRIPWRYSRATCHTAGCCHLANSMIWSQSYVSHCRVLQYIIIHLPYWKSFFAMFYFLCFLMQFGLWRAAAFVSCPIHLLLVTLASYLTMRTNIFYSVLFGVTVEDINKVDVCCYQQTSTLFVSLDGKNWMTTLDTPPVILYHKARYWSRNATFSYPNCLWHTIREVSVRILP